MGMEGVQGQQHQIINQQEQQERYRIRSTLPPRALTSFECVLLSMASNAHRNPLKALVVEVAAVDALYLSTMLHMFHCETTVAKSGKEALDLLLEGKKFDIVFCAKYMPMMKGPEAVEKIRAMGQTDVKIVGVSVDDDAKEEFMSAGADAFVPKPMNLDVMGSILQEVINTKNNTIV